MAVTQKTAVNFSIDQGADFSKNFTVTTDGSTAYDISDLTLNTTYIWQAKAFCSPGNTPNSSWSVVDTFITANFPSLESPVTSDSM